MEGDITSLPFENNSFDVVISNTVSEHIEPDKFYGEQLRVLKPDGTCLLLSSRKGIIVAPGCMHLSEYEKSFWQKAGRYDDTFSKYSICKYPMNEAELPLTMESYGFKNIRTGFVAVDLTPDNPKFPPAFARSIINADRYSEIDAVNSVLYTMPKHFSIEETEEMKRLAHARYDTRIAQYNRGEKQWDTNVSMIMVIRAVK